MKEKQVFMELLYKTITNIEIWQDVLAYLCNITNAPKGILMLRNIESAELLIPKNIHIDLKSPMIYGLSDIEIETYIKKYYQFDPWTKIEKEHHPLTPYAMSEHFPISELKKTKFWEWLQPQNISDSIVVEIHHSAEHWVSINLFFDGYDEKTKQDALTILNKHQIIMNNVWHLGLQFRASNASPESLIYFIEQQDLPSILIDHNLKVIHTNKKADFFLQDPKNLIKKSSGYLFIRNKQKQKSLKEAISSLSDNPFNPKSPPHATIPFDNWICTATLLSEAQNIVGEDTAIRMLTFRSNIILSNAQQALPIWETPSLTRREKELVEILALGGKVVDFQNKYRLTKSTAYTHWTNVKEKLKVVDRTEILLIHQNFLKTST